MAHRVGHGYGVVNTMNAIINRRSHRRYTSQTISPDRIETLLRGAMAAPSGANDQPWHFVVVDSKRLLVSLSKAQPYGAPLASAALGIVVCGDPTLKKFPDYREFWVQDCAAATENLLLTAEDLGIGGVWLGLYPMRDWVATVRSLLGVPEPVIPFAMLSLGYPAEKMPPANRFHPERIHTNGWNA